MSQPQTQEDKLMGHLKIRVIEGEGLCARNINLIPTKKKSRHSDPFVIISYGTKAVKTSVKYKTVNPVWNETFFLNVSQFESKYKLLLTVYDKDKYSHDDFMGKCELDMSQFTDIKEPNDNTQLGEFGITNNTEFGKTGDLICLDEEPQVVEFDERAKFQKDEESSNLISIEINYVMNKQIPIAGSVDDPFDMFHSDPSSQLSSRAVSPNREDNEPLENNHSNSTSDSETLSDDNNNSNVCGEDKVKHGKHGVSHSKYKCHDIWMDLEPLDDNKKKRRNLGKIHFQVQFFDKEDIETTFCNNLIKLFAMNKKGKFSLYEFRALMEAIGNSDLTEDDTDKLFADLEKDENSETTVKQLLQLLTEKRHYFNEQVLSSLTDDEFEQSMSAADDFVVSGFLMTTYNSKSWLKRIKKFFKSDKAGLNLIRETGEIIVMNREDGTLLEEKIPPYIKLAFRAMYRSYGGRKAIEKQSVRNFLRNMTHKMGKKYSQHASVKHILNFIKYHNINQDDILEDLSTFKTFNEFFYRKLKPGVRPIAQPNNESVCVCPADCRLLVYQTLDDSQKIWVKGDQFTLLNLTKSEELAMQFNHGSIAICRLAPQDYHRFHFPVSGVVSDIKYIDGDYFTVNPVAVRSELDVFTENKRAYIEIRTPTFGKVLYVAVGATMVGSIEFTVEKGQQVSKGDEAGFFAFGGSTILVLFQPLTVNFSRDLVNNSVKPLETLVRMGQELGMAT